MDDALVSRFVQANLSRYDKTGDTHYDIASALIKSIRSSDPDGAVYWLARMIEGGEDAKCIAAQEDDIIGFINENNCSMYINCSAWSRPKLNTKIGFNTTHHPPTPPPQTFLPEGVALQF